MPDEFYLARVHAGTSTMERGAHAGYHGAPLATMGTPVHPWPPATAAHVRAPTAAAVGSARGAHFRNNQFRHLGPDLVVRLELRL